MKILSLFLTILGLTGLQAKIIYVDAASNGGTGQSWGDAFPTLVEGLADAEAGDEIRAAQGTYYPSLDPTTAPRTASFQLVSDVTVQGGFSASLNISDPARFPSILSGDIGIADDNSDNSYHVVVASGTSPLTLLQGFTITQGNANLFLSTNAAGGGLYLSNSSLLIEDCLFLENQALAGGACDTRSASFASFTNCLFRGNSADSGGAINTNASTNTFTNCAFQGNTSVNQGGAISEGNSLSTTLINCSFQGNRASTGGAYYLIQSSPSFMNCILWHNQAAGVRTSQEASIAYAFGGSPVFTKCLIENWSAADLNLSGADNLDGIDSINDPQFIQEILPSSAPTTEGSLHLDRNSPALNVGRTSANNTFTDLAGNDRLVDGTIDLGAYEWQHPIYVVGGITTGAMNGLTWTDAFPYLQDALAIAREGREIWVAGGTYYPDEGTGQTNDDREATFQLVDGVRLYGGFVRGEIDIQRVAIAFGGRQDSILSGEIGNPDSLADNSAHVVTGSGTKSHTLLDRFTITGGNAFALPQGSIVSGGGLINQQGSPTIVDCLFEKNQAHNEGGAVANFSRSAPTFLNCQFLENSPLFDGGAISNYYSSPTFINCLFRGNHASGVGGAIVSSWSSPAITNCLFQGNVGGHGGAIHDYNSPSEITNCSFQGNFSVFQGTIACQGTSSPTITNTVIWNNHSEDLDPPSSSITVTGTGTATFEHCLIQHWSDTELNALGSNNLDGTDPANDPLFAFPIEASATPSTLGDLRLKAGSPLLEAGLNSANTAMTDLGDNARIDGTIDIGAYEGFIEGQELIVALWYSDFDGDGHTFGIEHSIGTNPDLPDIGSPKNLRVSHAPTAQTFTFSVNPDLANNSRIILLQSTDLQTFSPIFTYPKGGLIATIQGVHFNFTNNVVTLTLTDERFSGPSGPKNFYRLVATPPPPSFGIGF